MEMSDLTECIRDKLNQLRREKQKRYEQTCQRLGQEIHQKTVYSRELYCKFEQAVSNYQTASEAPVDFDYNDSQKDDVSEESESEEEEEVEVETDDKNHGRNGYGEGVYGRRKDEGVDENGGLENLISIENLVNRETPMAMEAEEDMDGGKRCERTGERMTDRMTDRMNDRMSDHMNERTRHNDRIAERANERSRADRLSQVPLVERSTNRLGKNNRKPETKPKPKPKPKPSSREARINAARDKCDELKKQRELVEESLRKMNYRLSFAREDYQRELHVFDDLENELTSISQTFEETQKRALEQFFAGLNDKNVDVYDEYRKFQESATQEFLEKRGRKRKEVEELQAQVRGQKRIKNAALLTTVVALAPWIGTMALGLWEKFLILQGQLGE